MSNIPPAATNEERVLGALNRLLGQKDEHASALTKLFHQQQLHEERTANHFERFGEMFKGVNARLTKLEDSSEDTGQYRVDDLEARLASETKLKESMMKGAGSIILLLIGAVVTLVFRKAFGI